MQEKLVRDKIQEIVQKEGKNITFRVAEKQEYKRLLLTKLQEEVNEFILDQNEEEIADIFEVIDALIQEYSFSKEKIANIKKQKNIEKGKFKKMLVAFLSL